MAEIHPIGEFLLLDPVWFVKQDRIDVWINVDHFAAAAVNAWSLDGFLVDLKTDLSRVVTHMQDDRDLSQGF